MDKPASRVSQKCIQIKQLLSWPAAVKEAGLDFPPWTSDSAENIH